MDMHATEPATATTLADLIGWQVQREQHRPLLTVYDDVTGGRTELSYATADNWASKTANLLAEEFDLAPAASLALDVDGHWTTAVLVLACWKLGAAVHVSAAAPASALVCRHESRIGGETPGPTLIVGDGLRAEPTGDVPTGEHVVLLGEDVHAFADDYDDPAVDAATPALGLATRLDRTEALGLFAGVIAASGSIVVHRPPPEDLPVGRWRTERVTVVVGDAGTADPGDTTGMSDIPFVPLRSPTDGQMATSG
jgi:hypothetical protein